MKRILKLIQKQIYLVYIAILSAGGTVKRPTQEGPAMTFNNIKGFPGKRVNIGTMASRKRVGQILHHDYRTLGRFLKDAVEYPLNQ